MHQEHSRAAASLGKRPDPGGPGPNLREAPRPSAPSPWQIPPTYPSTLANGQSSPASWCKHRLARQGLSHPSCRRAKFLGACARRRAHGREHVILGWRHSMERAPRNRWPRRAGMSWEPEIHSMEATHAPRSECFGRDAAPTPHAGPARRRDPAARAGALRLTAFLGAAGEWCPQGASLFRQTESPWPTRADRQAACARRRAHSREDIIW